MVWSEKQIKWLEENRDLIDSYSLSGFTELPESVLNKNLKIFMTVYNPQGKFIVAVDNKTEYRTFRLILYTNLEISTPSETKGYIGVFHKIPNDESISKESLVPLLRTYLKVGFLVPERFLENLSDRVTINLWR